MKSSLSTYCLPVALILLCQLAGMVYSKIECPPGGAKIVFCHDDQECIKDSCHEKRAKLADAKSQLILWGTVFGVILIVATAIMCWRREGRLCEDKPCCSCCQCKKYKMFMSELNTELDRHAELERRAGRQKKLKENLKKEKLKEKKKVNEEKRKKFEESKTPGNRLESAVIKEKDAFDIAEFEEDE
ncbi:hypothetical protein SNEBB_009830 [Seison nebaliae]|nr:hypothetical protein SNEBB_009830 [Seison nebaliae]